MENEIKNTQELSAAQAAQKNTSGGIKLVTKLSAAQAAQKPRDLPLAGSSSALRRTGGSENPPRLNIPTVLALRRTGGSEI